MLGEVYDGSSTSPLYYQTLGKIRISHPLICMFYIILISSHPPNEFVVARWAPQPLEWWDVIGHGGHILVAGGGYDREHPGDRSQTRGGERQYNMDLDLPREGNFCRTLLIMQNILPQWSMRLHRWFIFMDIFSAWTQIWSHILENIMILLAREKIRKWSFWEKIIPLQAFHIWKRMHIRKMFQTSKSGN